MINQKSTENRIKILNGTLSFAWLKPFCPVATSPPSSWSVCSQTGPELPPRSGRLCPASLAAHCGQDQLDPAVSAVCVCLEKTFGKYTHIGGIQFIVCSLWIQEVSHRPVRPAARRPVLHPPVSQRGFRAPIPQCTAGALPDPARQPLLQHLQGVSAGT